MSQRQVFMLIGVWVMIVLFLGFPASWDRVLLFATGILIVFMAYRMKASGPSGPSSSSSAKADATFVETRQAPAAPVSAHEPAASTPVPAPDPVPDYQPDIKPDAHEPMAGSL